MADETEVVPRPESQQAPRTTQPEPDFRWWQRYLAGIALLGVVWWLYGLAMRSEGKSWAVWVLWLAAIVWGWWALYLMHEVGKVLLWLLGIGVAGWLVWVCFKGLGTVPTGTAILIGACIIASAVSNANKR